MRRFVVVGVQRSGTTLVTTSLASHPDIHCAGELFKMRKPQSEVDVLDSGYQTFLEGSVGRRVADRIFRRRVVASFLDAFYDRRDSKATGFKLMNNQTLPGRFPMVVRYVVKHQINVIQVIRNNVFKTHLSRVVAQRGRIFHTTDRPATPETVIVPTVKLVRQLDAIAAQNERLQRLFATPVPYLVCRYEDYVADPQSEGARLLSFLQVPKAELRSPLKKIGSDNLAEVVENIEEVRQCLRGTAHERWTT